MRKGLTEIVLILDRSGSMEAIKADAEGGLRAFVNGQRKAPGECRLTFYRFDGQIERVIEDRDIRDVREDELRLEPRGATALFDAIGRAITEVGSRLASRREEDRPEHVIVVAVTDGQENASVEYPRRFGSGGWNFTYRFFENRDGATRIAEMIKRQREQYNWQFVFIGSTEESIQTARDLGYSPNMTLSNNPTGKSYAATYSVMSANVSEIRSGGGAQSLSFTDEQRAQVKSDTLDGVSSSGHS